jgi:hypothetical protein
MRILYLDINLKYHNPTRNLLPSLLSIYNDVFIYGPGYQNDNVLEDGIEKFYENNGPFDIVCSNEHISVFYPEYKAHNTVYMRDVAKGFHYNFKIKYKYFDDMQAFFQKFTGHKVLFLMEFDRFWMSSYRLDILLSLNAYIVGYGKNYSIKKEDCPYAKNEYFYESITNNWYDFVCSYDKIIQLVHYVDNSEFEWSNLEGRAYECSALGTGYWSRIEVAKLLKQHKIKLPSRYLQTNKIYDFMDRVIGFNPNNTRLGICINNRVFNNIIEDSVASYTCGSGNMQFIRKFIEIPSKGTVLICMPFVGFEDVGFKNGVNCLTIEHPKQIIDALNTIATDKEYASQLANAGRKMVFEKHSINARAGQLQNAFTAIVAGRFAKTYWQNGDFVVEQR